jgi:hypothetical protein
MIAAFMDRAVKKPAISARLLNADKGLPALEQTMHKFFVLLHSSVKAIRNRHITSSYGGD